MVYRLNERIKASTIANDFAFDLLGGDIGIECASNLANISIGALVFYNGKIMLPEAINIAGVVVLTGKDGVDALKNRGGTFLVAEKPRFDFARVLDYLDRHVGFVAPSQPPEIHKTAKLGRNVTLSNGVKVGEGSIIGDNVFLGENCQVGVNVIIKNGAVIGSDGFGFDRSDWGEELIMMKHFGAVTLEDRTYVGANTTIDRGTFSNTIIKMGAKIDNLVHIAHNCQIGESSLVIAGAVLCGGVKIGRGAWIGPNAVVKQKLEIGENSLVGMGVIVQKNLAPGMTMMAGDDKLFDSKRGV